MSDLIRNHVPTMACRAKMSQILETAFNTLALHTHFGQLASLSELQIEIALKQAGALTFKVDHA
jgi:hypothetical protein